MICASLLPFTLNLKIGACKGGMSFMAAARMNIWFNESDFDLRIRN